MGESAGGSTAGADSTTGTGGGGLWQRLRAMFGAQESIARPLEPDDPELVVVAESDDETAAASSVLDGSQWRAGEPAVLRHILEVPDYGVAAVVDIASLDGYSQTEGPDPGLLGGGQAASGAVLVMLSRAQEISAVGLSQERSRMASLGSRHRGRVRGWQVLQRPVVGVG